MKMASIAAALALLFFGCKESASTNSFATPGEELKDGHPLVHLPPVRTQPFEEGYNAGFAYAQEHATPKSPIPTDDESARVAREQAGDHPERDEHWEHGFAEGYADGVRKVVTTRR